MARFREYYDTARILRLKVPEFHRGGLFGVSQAVVFGTGGSNHNHSSSRSLLGQCYHLLLQQGDLRGCLRLLSNCPHRWWLWGRLLWDTLWLNFLSLRRGLNISDRGNKCQSRCFHTTKLILNLVSEFSEDSSTFKIRCVGS